jgi:hypothetical protein
MTTTMRRWVMTGVILFVGGVAVSAWMLYGRTFTIVIPQEKIQQALNEKFPINKTHLLIFTVQYANPRVILEEGSDRLTAGVDAKALFKMNDVSFSGTAVISGLLEYSRETGEFMLKQATVEKLDIEGIPERYAKKVNDVSTLAVKEYLDRKPVYRLKQSDVKQSLAKLALKKVTVRDQALVVTMGIGP